MGVKVNNPENLPDNIIQAAIEKMEKEGNSKVIAITVRSTDSPDEYEIVPVFKRINCNTEYLVGYIGPI